MILVAYSEPTDVKWQDWKTRATTAGIAMWTTFAKKAITESDISKKLYKECKDDLFRAFGNRCSFCETLIRGVDQPGDVDHYRPKCGVQDRDRKPVIVRLPRGAKGPHRGYFWLAYSWSNLLPICRHCNSPHRDEQSGKLIGKGTVFPIRGPRVAGRRGNLDAERPLLLHPRYHDPVQHFELDTDTGVLISKTDEAEVTVEILGLNRTGLVIQRRAAYREFRDALTKLANAAIDKTTGPDLGDAENMVAEYEADRLSYMLARRVAADEVAKRVSAIATRMSLLR